MKLLTLFSGLSRALISRYWSLIILFALLLPVTACKTTEKNYRQAYLKTIHARQAANDSLALGNQYIPVQSLPAGASTISTPAGTNFTLTVEPLTPVTDIQDLPTLPEALKPFSVIVAKFTQQFNAASMCHRWRQNGFPSAFVAYNPSIRRYIVIASSWHNIDDAAAAAADIALNPGSSSLGMQTECPYIARRQDYLGKKR